MKFLLKDGAKWLLLIACISISTYAGAATVYRDRYIPAGVCMVDFYGRTINAALIQQVEAGSYYDTTWIERPGFFFGDGKKSRRDYFGVKVTLVNNQYWFKEAATKDEAEMRKVAFLQLIKDTCK